MIEPFVPHVGAVFSADIAVPQHERELRFYSRVLGTGASPLWRGDDLMNNLGIPIIGLGAATADTADLPIQWMPHIQVADVAASARRAEAGGGSVLARSGSAGGTSEWAVILDPGGAAFGIIAVVPADRMPRDTGPAAHAASSGRIAWLDLTVPDASSTRDFYRAVVGWSVEDVEMKDGDAGYADYNMLNAAGTPSAGICHARGVNTGLPAVWMIYLPVGDLEESVGRVEAEGGSVLKAMRAAEGKLVYAAIRDPVGACLALVQG